MPVAEMPNSTAVSIVPPGKIVDFIDGTFRNDTPEEYVRQETLKSLVREYRYPKSDVAVEWPVQIGSRKVRADIAIFPPNTSRAERSQENVALLVECKKPGTSTSDRTDGVKQLQSYMAACPNVKVGLWTNGPAGGQEAFRLVMTGDKRVTEAVPDIPRYGQEEEIDRPTFDQLRPAASASLLFAFRRSHDYIAGNQGIHKEGAFWELLKLIFCKIDDERNSDNGLEFYATPGERSTSLGQGNVKKRLDKLFARVRADYPQIFAKSDVIELQPATLAYIVSQLQMFSLLESDIDVKGKAYEEIVGSNLRGDRGEFFTPRNVVHMMVRMVNPTESHLVIDPACGTGGFLIAAMNHVVDGIKEHVLSSGRRPETREQAIRDRVQRFLRDGLVGMDFNPELVKATKMNMVMNNDGAGGLFQANSLANPATWEPELCDRRLAGSVDLLLTNPPFGSKIPIDDRAILEQYDLGHTWSYEAGTDRWSMTDTVQKSQPPEILFIERCVSFLKPGTGRMAIVLPDGILGAPGLGYVREWILTNARVMASIDLHPDTFQPSVSVQTSVLVLERKTNEEMTLEAASGRKNDYAVFMAVANHVGHDKRGNKTYVRDEKGNEIVEEIEETTKERRDGRPVYRLQKSQRKVVDDNTLQIAEAFRAWLAEQL